MLFNTELLRDDANRFDAMLRIDAATQPASTQVDATNSARTARPVVCQAAADIATASTTSVDTTKALTSTHNVVKRIIVLAASASSKKLTTSLLKDSKGHAGAALKRLDFNQH